MSHCPKRSEGLPAHAVKAKSFSRSETCVPGPVLRDDPPARPPPLPGGPGCPVLRPSCPGALGRAPPLLGAPCLQVPPWARARLPRPLLRERLSLPAPAVSTATTRRAGCSCACPVSSTGDGGSAGARASLDASRLPGRAAVRGGRAVSVLGEGRAEESRQEGAFLLPTPRFRSETLWGQKLLTDRHHLRESGDESPPPRATPTARGASGQKRGSVWRAGAVPAPARRAETAPGRRGAGRRDPACPAGLTRPPRCQAGSG